MNNHITKLIKAVENCDISYSPAYTQDGKPDIGVRRHPQDMVLIDDTAWLIAGDIYNKTYNARIDNINTLGWYKPNGIYVSLRAQAIICGKIVQVHLGEYDVLTMFRLGNDGGTMKIAKK